MKIAIISKWDKTGGGASRVAEDLVKLLNQNGHTAHHYHAGDIKKNGFSRPLYGYFQSFFRKLYALMRKIGVTEFVPFELGFLISAVKKEKYDLLHFHDISSVISPLSLNYFSNRVPVVWTIHDCSPFTGGCLYAMECVKYQSNCLSCPRQGEWPIDSLFDLAFANRWLKSKLHKQDSISLVTPSQWMAKFALSSNMIRKMPMLISNGVDTKVYRPIDIDDERKKLGILEEQTVLLIVAGSLSDKRKGTRYALEAIKAIEDLNPFVILVGKAEDTLENELQGVSYHITGYIRDEEKLNAYYATADMFLNCTLADNQPLVVLETMASGTPTVGFKTGGVPEMVVHDETGFLVEQKDMSALKIALRDIVVNKRYVQWGENARKRVEKHYTADLFLKRHLELYNSLWANRNRYV